LSILNEKDFETSVRLTCPEMAWLMFNST
jgi:hypothetical protein